MNWIRRLGALAREATVSAVASPVASLTTVVIVAGMCATVLLTTGRTVGAEQAVLGSVDAAGTRSIVVRADPAAGLDSTVLARLARVDGIQWAAGFGPAFDVTNAAIGDAVKVPARLAWGEQFEALGMPSSAPATGASAWASDLALTQLGMADHVGAIHTADGASMTVAGRLTAPDWLTFLQPIVLLPQAAAEPGAVTVLVVIAERPDLVTPVSRVVQSLLAVDDPTKVTITTSETLAQLRAVIQGQLGSFGRGLVLLVLTVSGALVAAILTGLVTLRRKDFGRRRALGASRGLIVTLLLTQTAILAALGAALGITTASIALAATGDPLPGLAFSTAIGVLALITALAAAALPAAIAARRDPIKELRVP